MVVMWLRLRTTTAEEEYESVVLVANTNRDYSIIEARSVEDAIAQMSVMESLPVDKHPEKRLKAAFKAFSEAELPKVKAEKPGLTHTQYKDMIWKLWNKSHDNPLNKVEPSEFKSMHGYGQKGDQLYVDKLPDYPSIDRRQYGERSSAYLGREQNESTGHFGDSLGFAHQHQADMYDRLDQASVIRHEQMLKVQSLQSKPLDGGSRQVDYLVTRGAAIRHPADDLLSYASRVDASSSFYYKLPSTE